MTGNESEKRVYYINHRVELLIWLLIVCLFVAMFSLGSIFKEKNDTNDFQIFLQDVDGLIVGSPVRMMGVEVGYVKKIKPINNNEVYVNFLLTNPEVYIPQGTSATVEFSGLAGSKSLELYLPDENTYIERYSSLLSVNPPKRLHDAFGLLNDMFKKLGSIIYTTSSFGTKLQSENLAPIKIINQQEGLKDFIQYSDKFLDDSNKKALHMRKAVFGDKTNVK